MTNANVGITLDYGWTWKWFRYHVPTLD